MKFQAPSPSSRTPVSFQWPKRTFLLMYSSAMLMPPVKATLPSITRIFRWSRWFMASESTGMNRLKAMHFTPSRSSSA